MGAAAAGLESAGMMASADFHGEMLQSSPQEHFPGTLTLVMLVGIAALPVKPVHTFALGTSLLALFAALVFVTEGTSGFAGWSALPFVLSGVTVLIATGLTAVLYHQRATAFFARLQAEESFAELTRAQASLLLERNQAAQSRFAALLSHELNTPIGALSSAFETLARLVEDLETDSRKREALADAVRSGRSSFHRLSEISRRMRRLTNLDRAESRFVDVNELLRDTVSFLGAELGEARIDLRLSPLPPLYCRPQQIGAVVANLIRNAAAATGDKGRIEISSRSSPGQIAIRVSDDGRGIEPERLETLFEPAFGVDRGRMATKNWGLFVSRAIVVEHGGKLELESAPGRGTTANMTLPLPG